LKKIKFCKNVKNSKTGGDKRRALLGRRHIPPCLWCVKIKATGGDYGTKIQAAGV
jgi:hypothetical protein